MSDEERWQGPRPSAEWIADHQRRLQETLEEADRERERESSREVLATITAVAERAIRVFSGLPCQGTLGMLSRCTDAIAADCPERKSSSCPRRIQEFDRTRERQELIERLEWSGLPRGAARVALVPEPTEATQWVDDFLAVPQRKRILVLSGRPGVGKTVAGAYAIRRRPGRFVRASELTEATDQAREKRHVARTASLLVLDDLGTEYVDGKGWSQSLIEPLLSGRFDDVLPTIVTTNLDAEAFAQRYGARIADRIGGEGIFAELRGESRRGAP